MEMKKVGSLLRQLTVWAKKYKYAALVLAVGLVLLLLPGKSSSLGASAAALQSGEDGTRQELRDFQTQLEDLLSGIDGAGRCRVLLTLDYGPEQVYQTDQRREDGSFESQTVLYQSSGSQKLPVVTRTRYPIYKGALVVCQGAERAAVRLSIIEAVSGLTGLGSDKICVVKMKGQ